MNPIWLAAAASAFALANGDEVKYQMHGKGWLDYGRIMHAEDTIVNALSPDDILNYDGNTLQSIGAQVTVVADLSEHLEGGFGFGYYKASHALGSGQFQYLTISLFQNFITQSRLTWYSGEKAAPNLSLTVGGFNYNYNPDVKNLGLYLLRGPVYPGILMGGFQDFSADTTKANLLGLKLHHSMGMFSQDLILNNERDIPPTFDWSLAYMAKLDLGAVQIGAGINLYRLIPYNSMLESPGDDTSLVNGSARRRFLDIDNSNPAAPDTTVLTMQGQKVVGQFSLSLQKLFGMELPGNPDDLKIYGEAGIIGVQSYGKIYGKIGERIPIMVGVNMPTFGFLDHLSIEVEHYGAKYRNDLAGTGYVYDEVAPWTVKAHPIATPKPLTNADYGIDTAGVFKKSTDTAGVSVRGTAMDKENLTKDDLKWSLFAEKVVSGHIQFIGQVANDHYRPRPVASGLIKSWGGTAEAFASPKDWYYMFRIGYFF